MYLAITGRETAIAIAELEALFDSSLITPFSNDAALIDDKTAPTCFRRIGSSIKLARVLDIVDFESFQPRRWLDEHLTDSIELTNNRKMNLGVSCYGAPRLHRDLFHRLNRVLSDAGKNVRTINPKHNGRMSSAQVFHNKLDMERNLEFICVRNGDKLALAVTTNVQNISAYATRDRGRPKRDTYVGMLPPKLAQTLVNLSSIANPDKVVLLDPFCGTGVTLIEASLMGFRAYGSDIEQRMIDYSQENLAWVDEVKHILPWRLETMDARKGNWQPPIATVVSEIDLGQPLDSQPHPAQLERLRAEAHELIIEFLNNLQPQLTGGTPVVLAIPAWRVGSEFKPAATLDDLESLGYNSIEFQHVDGDALLYARPDQYVGRKIMVLKRK